MGQEFFIKSSNLESKVRSLLPSQGGQGAGFDLSASTQIVPIVDLTESAEGSNLRQDLQTAVDFATTRTAITNASNTTIISNTGFYQVGVNCNGSSGAGILAIDDGATSKIVRTYVFDATANNVVDNLVVYLRAGDSLLGTSTSATCDLFTFTRQIANIDGELTNPLGFS